MVPGNIVEIFGALTVGFFALFAFSLVLWVFDRNSLSYAKYMSGWGFKPQANLWSFVFVLFCYGSGLLIEDLTDHLTDSDAKYDDCFWFDPRPYQQEILRREGFHRLRSLARIESTGKRELNALGRDVFFDQEFIREIRSNAEVLENAQHNSISKVEDEVSRFCKLDESSAIAEVNGIYYAAKNWCYDQDNYFAELEEIQRRIDFSRSIFLLSSWVILMFIPTGIFDSILIFRFKSWYQRTLADVFGTNLHVKSVNDPQNPMYENAKFLGVLDDSWNACWSKEWWWRISKVIVGLCVICFVAKLGYDHAEEVFNERAFGYHVSWRHREASNKDDLNTKPVSSSKRISSKVSEKNRDALLWMRTSAEYVAICKQTLNHANHVLRQMDLDENESNVVIMDLDETVLDNTAYNLQLLKEGLGYSQESWDEWLANNSAQVRLVPGVSNFLDNLPKHLEVIYVSNRTEKHRQITIDTLLRLGAAPNCPPKEMTKEFNQYWDTHLYLKTNTSSKVQRRHEIQMSNSVVMLVGDNLADFSERFEHNNSKWMERRSLAQDTNEFGVKWFVLPNPLYGDWEYQLNDKVVEKIFEFQIDNRKL